MKLKFLALSVAVLLASCGSKPSPISKDSVVEGIAYVGLTVTDLEASTKLYKNANLKEVQTKTQRNVVWNTLTGEKGTEVKTRLLRSANGQIRMLEFTNPTDIARSTPPVPVNGPGYAHLCIQADQTTKMYEKFIDGGARVIGDPEMVQLSSLSPVKYGYLHDLDGAVIEVEHVDLQKAKLKEPPKHRHRLRHIAFATPDLERLTGFYADFLDQPKPRRIGGKKGFAGEKLDKVSGLPNSRIKMAWFQTRNMEIELSQYISHPTEVSGPRAVDAVGLAFIMFDVTNLADAKAKFEEVGGSIITDELDMDGGKVIFGLDIDQNLVGMQVLPKDAPASSDHFPNQGI